MTERITEEQLAELERIARNALKWGPEYRNAFFAATFLELFVEIRALRAEVARLERIVGKQPLIEKANP